MSSENGVPDTRVVPWRIAGSIPMPSTDRRRRGKIFWKLGGRDRDSERVGGRRTRHLSKTFQLSDQLSWHLLARTNGGFWFRLSCFQKNTQLIKSELILENFMCLYAQSFTNPTWAQTHRVPRPTTNLHFFCLRTRLDAFLPLFPPPPPPPASSLATPLLPFLLQHATF